VASKVQTETLETIGLLRCDNASYLL